MAGFEFAYRLSGGAPTIQDLLSKNTATHTKGDLVGLDHPSLKAEDLSRYIL